MLAVLEKQVQIVENVRREWIREDASVAERPVAPLHAVLKPSHERSPAQCLYGRIDDLSLRQELVGNLAIVKRGLHGLKVEVRAEKWVGRGCAQLSLLRDGERRASSEAGVTRIKRHEDAGERPRFN